MSTPRQYRGAKRVRLDIGCCLAATGRSHTLSQRLRLNRFTSCLFVCTIMAIFSDLSRNDPQRYFLVEASPSPSTSRAFRFRLPGRRFDRGDDDFESKSNNLFGMGREFDLFDTRNSVEEETDQSIAMDATIRQPPDEALSSSSPPEIHPTPEAAKVTLSSQQRRHRAGGGSRPSLSSGRVGGSFPSSRPSYSSSFQSSTTFFQPFSDWWTSTISPNIKNWPKLQCRVEPTTTLKIRKTFRPLKTIVRLGADYNTQLGVWQFKSSWEDEIIGGKLTLAGRELQLTKSWQLSVGAVEDLVTRLRFRAAVDLQTWKAYARVGFRTERLSPINVMEGFTLMKRLPLDGNKGHIKLEVKANVALPEPEIEYSTETQRSLIGMGDIQLNVEELNLVLDY